MAAVCKLCCCSLIWCTGFDGHDDTMGGKIVIVKLMIQITCWRMKIVECLLTPKGLGDPYVGFGGLGRLL